MAANTDELAAKCRRTVRFSLVGPVGLSGENVNDYNRVNSLLFVEQAFYEQSWMPGIKRRGVRLRGARANSWLVELSSFLKVIHFDQTFEG
jgi:hypothetical protein